MTTSVSSPTQDHKLSKVEGIKERSNYLREPLATELLNDENFFSDNAVQILKFHGSYQQDNRDNRAKGQEKDYQMMLRTRNPGGFIPPSLYLTQPHPLTLLSRTLHLPRTMTSFVYNKTNGARGSSLLDVRATG
jgi:hypothetical protein